MLLMRHEHSKKVKLTSASKSMRGFPLKVVLKEFCSTEASEDLRYASMHTPTDTLEEMLAVSNLRNADYLGSDSILKPQW